MLIVFYLNTDILLKQINGTFKRFLYYNILSILTCTSVLSCTHFAIISDAKPTLCMSIVSKGFGLPFAGKCMNTGAVLILNYINRKY